ncbi:gamma-butyrobetaine hydroxylase [Burkholderia pseudomallei]|nr:taurine catabolism dioxygenase TauD, TfdA family protein [Burkholderia pseudomallei MSHR5596]CAK1282398.1 gamma-butyrobetaine hydroxylase [Burkholderia pseudomallei]
MTILYETVAADLKQKAVAVRRGEVDLLEISEALQTLAGRDLRMSPPDLLGEPNSLTPKKWLSYGHASYDLPLHTDYPDFASPPRFVLLKCHSAGKTPVETVFYDVGNEALKHPERVTLLSEPWLTTGGVESSRLVRLLTIDPVSRSPLLRYASNVMRPFFPSSSRGRQILFEIVGTSYPLAIVLMPGDIVVWDNWRVLHSRRAAEIVPSTWMAGPGRILERWKWI